ILRANDLFRAAMGYREDELRGRHHSMLVLPEEARAPAYKDFWRKLRGGLYDTGQYLRIGKNGRQVWIEASYNPIFDAEGRPFKVVKYATDITEQQRRQADTEGQLKAISKVQGIIEFDLDSTILRANDLFLA
ncbi:PAS domain-containing protein, partial [Campylobacter lari]|nr:PAS domain-containing protein [Campylobacter lari]